jgi:hypothetical protein
MMPKHLTVKEIAEWVRAMEKRGMPVVRIKQAYIDDFPNFGHEPPTIEQMQAKLAALGVGVGRYIAAADEDSVGFVFCNRSPGGKWLWEQRKRREMN